MNTLIRQILPKKHILWLWLLLTQDKIINLVVSDAFVILNFRKKTNLKSHWCLSLLPSNHIRQETKDIVYHLLISDSFCFGSLLLLSEHPLKPFLPLDGSQLLSSALLGRQEGLVGERNLVTWAMPSTYTKALRYAWKNKPRKQKMYKVADSRPSSSS